MSDKSNEYGFVPSSPTQADGANTGIFEVNDVVDLITSGQWYSGFVADDLNLIYTYTFTGAESTVDFLSTDIDPTVYDTLYLVGDISGTSMTSMNVVFSDDDLSSTVTTNINRTVAYGNPSGTFTRSAAAENPATLMTPAITGDIVFGYMISGLKNNNNIAQGINGYTISDDGTNCETRYYGANFGSDELNSFRFGNISGVDAGSTIKVYSYKAA
tara:strand:- start:1230 stop:1874 length:645 start_codon:yes stop_codon:yes gene_type:complete